MQENIVSLLRCPQCQARDFRLEIVLKDRTGDIKKGTVICRTCHSIYPIEEYALEFLPSYLSYHQNRKRGKKHSPQLEQQQYFDWYADNETQSYANYAESTFWKTTDELIFNRWKTLIPPKSRLLDVGSAQGRSAFLVADLPIDIIAFDISKNMIRQAIKRYKKNRYRATMSFIVADASHFPFCNSTFDTVLLYGVLHHLADPAVAALEIVRVLRKGGRYLGLENQASSLRRIFDILQAIRPIWYEKAGVKPLMTKQDFSMWFPNMPIAISTRTFVPPHLINILPISLARWLISTSDRWAGGSSFLSKFGGLLVIEGKKSS